MSALHPYGSGGVLSFLRGAIFESLNSLCSSVSASQEGERQGCNIVQSMLEMSASLNIEPRHTRTPTLSED